mmetsp:Transcript_26415/g.77610  ORF Transcript_26415/g.77610 Transcript_26415/m.77610 type:complete len:241 (-) Transcript_26415:769-1491(-)
MRRRDAKARAAQEQGRCGVAHDDDGDLAGEELAREARHLLRVVDHDWHHGAAVVTEHLAAHGHEATSEEERVFPEGLELGGAEARRGGVGAARGLGLADHAQGGHHLLHRRRRHGRRVQRALGAHPQCLDHPAVRRHVAPHAAKALGESSHHHVNVARGHAQELRHAAARGSHGADGVGLVEVEVGAVGLLERHGFAQAAKLSLHGIDALDDDDHLAPGGARAGLAAGARGAELGLQVDH